MWFIFYVVQTNKMTVNSQTLLYEMTLKYNFCSKKL